jgi:VIT1/CCC1 family predicted Fe2+/Mn2+ transporter
MLVALVLASRPAAGQVSALIAPSSPAPPSHRYSTTARRASGGGFWRGRAHGAPGGGARQRAAREAFARGASKRRGGPASAPTARAPGDEPTGAGQESGPRGERPRERSFGVLVEGGNLRATVMGGTDGLITSLAFVFGVAGLAGSTQLAILAGVISAVGGALSMAAGEWLSVTSQNEKYRSTLHTLDRLLRDDPRAAEATLLEAAAKRGFSPAHAKDLARALLQEPDRLEAAAIDLGLIPRKLDCPTGAALSSFASFLLGATIPLVPLVIGANGLSLTLSAAVSAVALTAGGAWLASTSGKSPLLGALRMLGLGGAAAAATYGTGVLATTIFPWP